MSSEPDRMLVLIDAATERLVATAWGLGDDDVRLPSSLPGWTRGHVLTHLARGGEAIGRLLDGIRTGVPGQAYTSQQERDEAVERGAGRGAAELVADLTESAARFRDAATGVPADAWDRSARGLVGDPFPARQLLQRRLVELELHHADLDAGYTTRNGRRSSPAWTWPSPCAVSGRSVGAGGAVALRMS